MFRKCPVCGNEILDDSVKFCPKCGTDCTPRQSWVCKKCNTENAAEADFCKSCGASRKAQEEQTGSFREKIRQMVQHVYFKYAMIALVVMLVGGAGSYYYFNNMNEGHYLTRYAEAARNLNDTNDILVSATKADNLKSDTAAGDAKKQLQSQKDTLDELAKGFSEHKAFKNYETQHKKTLELLQKESAVLEQTMLVLDKPLEENSDTVIASIKEDLATLKDTSEQIQVPNANFVSGTDLSVVPQQLTAFVTAQRKAEDEKKKALQAKQDKLNAMNDFFQKMDSAIQRYDSEKTDLNGMMQNSRQGSIMWNDYFNIINRAKGARLGVRSQINSIKAPAGTEKLKQDFSKVLSESIQYCELMSIGSHLEFYNHYGDAQLKYNAAQKVDKQVQDDYKAFIDNYQAEKARLTNADNL